MTRDTEKCPLSVLPCKRVYFEKIYERVSVERGSTVRYMVRNLAITTMQLYKEKNLNKLSTSVYRENNLKCAEFNPSYIYSG